MNLLLTKLSINGFLVSLLICMLSAHLIAAELPDQFSALKIVASPHAAFIGWQCADSTHAAVSYVAYGRGKDLSLKSQETKEAFLNQQHWLRNLEPATAYSYQLVSIEDGVERRSPIGEFSTASLEERIPLSSSAETQVLNQAGATYYLTEDVIASGTGFEITADNVCLDLNGHSLTYADGIFGRWHGVLISAKSARVINGFLKQSAQATDGQAAGTYAIAAFGAAENAHIIGLHIYVHQRESYPICFVNQATDVHIEYNTCISDVSTFKNRHYPGNDMIRTDCNAGEVLIQNNICLNGPHRGITVFGKEGTAIIRANDVRHDQGYTNGYALNLAHNELKAEGNRITSCGRGIHISAANIEVFNNYLNLTQHMVFDDRPAGTTNFRHYYTENHGIKLEECGEGVKVHHNTVISHQPQPRPEELRRFSSAVKGTITHNSGEALIHDGSHFAPPTALNFHVGPNVMAEVYQNTFVATTSYTTARLDKEYYVPGEWAAPLRIANGNGQSDAGKYSVYIHDNVFKSNDAFIRGCEFTQTIRIENNSFELIEPMTSNHALVRGEADVFLRQLLKNGNNTFVGMQP